MPLRAAWCWFHLAAPLPPSVGRFERAFARFTHLSLYLLLIGKPLAGYFNATGAPPPKPPLFALSRFGNDQAEPWRLEEFEGFGEAARDAQLLPPALHNELGRPIRRRSSLDDAVRRCLVSVPKNRKYRHTVPVIDRIVAPNPARDMPAVKTEKQVQFEASEVQRPVLRPIIPERQHHRTFSAHCCPSRFVVVT